MKKNVGFRYNNNPSNKRMSLLSKNKKLNEDRNIQNNNLKPQLEELVYIASKIDTEVSEDDKYSLIFDFNASATEEEIKNLEKEIDTSLPIGYKEFLFLK